MQNANGYIINRSNYTIRKRNKKNPNGDIYERDFMTTTNLGGWDGSTIPYGEGNFKMRPASEIYGYERKHRYGDWITNNGSSVWQQAFNTQNSGITSEGEIRIKPNYSSLLDFAYFGSCVDLIEFSVTDLIKNFPAELYFSDEKANYTNEQGVIVQLGEGTVVENPLNIDISSEKVPEDSDYSILRYFCSSFNKYELLNTKDELVGCINYWSVEREDTSCLKNGDLMATITLKANKYDQENVNHETTIIIEEYFRNEATVLILKEANSESQNGSETNDLTGYKIRPLSEYIDYYFDNINDFEGLLLNRRSNPIFSATIDNPNDTEYGILFNKKTFTWPTYHNWNLDVTSIDYSTYISSLISVAEFYDENFSDNMWRMLTHEAIKNMDSSKVGNVDEDDLQEGRSIIESVIKLYARQFDELKRIARSIKNQNVVTYDGNGNIPDYFLSDVLELSGWDVSSVISALNRGEKTDVLFDGESIGYSVNEMSTSFMRNLKINSKAILAKKGTRAGIEAILGLFGLVSADFAKSVGKSDYDYKISEYVVVAHNTHEDVVPVEEELPVETYNQLKLSIDTERDGAPVGTDGLPVRIIEFMDSAGTEMKYMIPWFERGEKLDGDVYFEMNGGWGRVNSKDINENIAERIKKIVSDDHFTIYGETLKYLKVVNNIDSLIGVVEDYVDNGNIFYVDDIKDYIEQYGGSEEDSSHYFILKDKNYCHEISENGWCNIPNSDIEKGINDGTKVLYLESIVDQYKGNNPHVGYGKYDGGNEFFEYVAQTFKYSIENDNFSDSAYDCSGELKEEIINTGFENIFDENHKVNYQEDNVKCWYFTDKYNNKRANELVEDETGVYSIATSEETIVPIGESANTYTLFDSELRPFNLETQEDGDSDIAAANSVVNAKRMKISFKVDNTYVEDFRKYFTTCIYPYLVQMVPSTVLLEIEIEDDNIEYTCLETPAVIGIVDMYEESCEGCECEGCECEGCECEHAACEGEDCSEGEEGDLVIDDTVFEPECDDCEGFDSEFNTECDNDAPLCDSIDPCDGTPVPQPNEDDECENDCDCDTGCDEIIPSCDSIDPCDGTPSPQPNEDDECENDCEAPCEEAIDEPEN